MRTFRLALPVLPIPCAQRCCNALFRCCSFRLSRSLIQCARCQNEQPDSFGQHQLVVDILQAPAESIEVRWTRLCADAQAEQQAAQADLVAVGSNGDALQATYRRVGLDSDSEDAAAAPPRKQQKGRVPGSRKSRGAADVRQQSAGHAAKPQPGAAAVEDVEAARAGAPGLDLRMSAGAPVIAAAALTMSWGSCAA